MLRVQSHGQSDSHLIPLLAQEYSLNYSRTTLFRQNSDCRLDVGPCHLAMTSLPRMAHDILGALCRLPNDSLASLLADFSPLLTVGFDDGQILAEIFIVGLEKTLWENGEICISIDMWLKRLISSAQLPYYSLR